MNHLLFEVVRTDSVLYAQICQLPVSAYKACIDPKLVYEAINAWYEDETDVNQLHDEATITKMLSKTLDQDEIYEVLEQYRHDEYLVKSCRHELM